MRLRVSKYEKYLYILPTIIFLLVFLMIPLINMLRYSMMDVSLVGGGKGFVGFKNYREIFSSPGFLATMGRTAIWLVGSMVGMIAFGTIVAFALKKKTPFNRVFSILVVIPWVIPEAFSALMWGWLLNVYYGFVNNFLLYFDLIKQPISFLSTSTALATVIIVRVWKGTPFLIINLLAALQTVPKDVEEAAEIDGATRLQKLWYIEFPLVRSVFIVTILILATWTLQMFDTIFLLTGGGPHHATEIISMAIYNSAFIDKNIGIACALAVFTMIIVLALSIISFKKEKAGTL